jgi:hypothetical protein
VYDVNGGGGAVAEVVESLRQARFPMGSLDIFKRPTPSVRIQ